MSTKICLIGIDGLRLDVALASSAMPTLAEAVNHGIFRELRMPVPTLSGPGWSTLLTGCGPDEHGVTDNYFVGNRLLHCPDLLSRAYFANQKVGTMAAAGWPALVDPAGVGPVIWARAEQQRAGQHRVISRDGEIYGYKIVDAEIATFAVAGVSGYGPDLSFVYFCDIDDEGHLFGPHSPEYAAAMGRVEGHLARIKAAIAHRAKTCGEDWLLVLTTDHGHLDSGGHGGGSEHETASFIAALAFGNLAASDLNWPETMAPRDLAPLLLSHLGS